MTPNQIAIMKTMLRESEQTGYGPDEVLFPHRTFERVLKLDYKTISKEMRGLRDMGFVYHANGGMDEDGELRGSGNGLTTSGYDEVRKHFSEEELELL